MQITIVYNERTKEIVAEFWDNDAAWQFANAALLEGKVYTAIYK